MAETALQGSVLAILLYDVCEEIRLEELRALLAAQRQRPAFKHPAAEQVRVEHPPVLEGLAPLIFDGGDRVEAQVKYYDYGVISIIFQRPFQGEWSDLVALSAHWISGTELEQHAGRIVRDKLQRAAPALIKPYPQWLSEDYFIFLVTAMEGNPNGADLLAQCGGTIAQIVRGESMPLSAGERAEVLQSSISYYPQDLTVIGWNAAFVYDTPSGAETAIQMLEYANSQLLEFRYYDDYLTRELAGVYRLLDRGTGVLARWRLARAATKLHVFTLEVTELAERVDNAIKFLSDMFSARLYRLAASKVGVPDYKDLVNQKLERAGDLYGFMVEQFQQGRTFALEVMVVVILIIESRLLVSRKMKSRQHSAVSTQPPWVVRTLWPVCTSVFVLSAER